MAYRDDTGDPYVIPGTEVLRNLAGIRDAASLALFEADMSILRQIELSEMPPSGPFDFARLKTIHRCLFQDVYAWAGEPRTIDIAKDGNRFGSHLHVEAFLSGFSRNWPRNGRSGSFRLRASIGPTGSRSISARSTPLTRSAKATAAASGSLSVNLGMRMASRFAGTR